MLFNGLMEYCVSSCNIISPGWMLKDIIIACVSLVSICCTVFIFFKSCNAFLLYNWNMKHLAANFAHKWIKIVAFKFFCTCMNDCYIFKHLICQLPAISQICELNQRSFIFSGHSVTLTRLLWQLANCNNRYQIKCDEY